MITLSVDDQRANTALMQMMLTKIDPNGMHMTASSMVEAYSLMNNEVQVVFLDIEMPGINGIEAAGTLKQKYGHINIVYVTGHPEYALDAITVHPSGFLLKPVCEQDIRRELKELRFPLETGVCMLRVRCAPFAVFFGETSIEFKRGRTIELFAYLVYRNGSFCTHGELLGVLWDGDPDKKGYLRQLILDMCECLKELGAEDIVEKKYGKIGLKMNLLQCEGNLSDIEEEFGWL